jgi:hypothetical protein
VHRRRALEVQAAAARRDGVLRAEDLATIGISRATADRRVRDKEWQRSAAGIYLPHDRVPDPPALARAAQDYAGAAGVVTGLLAAGALKMRWIPTATRAAVLVEGERRLHSTEHIDVRRCAALRELPRWQLGDITFAMGDRTVFDAALQLSDLRSVRGVVLGAVADRRTTVAAQRQILLAEPRNRTALLRRALRDAERGCASPPEAELVDELLGCRFPFLVNPEVYVGDLLLGYPDVWFLGLGCGSEMDSRERHKEDDDFDSTMGRHDHFGAYGIVLSHLTPRRFRRNPAAATAAVLSVVRARLLLPASFREPAGLRVVPRGPVLR